MKRVDPEVWRAFQQSNRNMIQYLTLLRTEGSATDFYLELGYEEQLRMFLSLGTTLVGMLAYVASREGNSLTEQIQTLALEIEGMTAEEAEQRINNPGRNLWRDENG